MWFKKLRYRKRQYIMIGSILLFTATILTMCVGFVGELGAYSKTCYTRKTCPDVYLYTAGKYDLEQEVEQEVAQNIEKIHQVDCTILQVPMKSNDRNIMVNTNYLTSGEQFMKFVDAGYVTIDSGKSAYPKEGEVWISKAQANPNSIEVGDTIQFGFDTVEELTVSAIYNGSFYTKGKGITIVNESFFKKHQIVMDRSIDAVNLKNATKEYSKEFKEATGVIGQAYTRAELMSEGSSGSSVIGKVGIIASGIVFILALAVIGYFIRTTIMKEYKNIGIYKSLGYETKEVVSLYKKGYLFVSAIALLLGSLIALPLIKMVCLAATTYLPGFELSRISVISVIVIPIILEGILWVSLKIVFKRLNEITPVEAIKDGNTASTDQIKKSVITNAKSSFAMAINHMFQYKKQSITIIAVMTFAITMSFLFIMTYYSCDNMDTNCNGWFSIPKGDCYVVGNIDETVIDYLKQNQEVKQFVYGSILHTQVDEFMGTHDIIGCKLIILNNTAEQITNIKPLQGRLPSAKDEIALSIVSAKQQNLEIGDYLTITLNNIEKEYLLTGYFGTMDDENEGSISGMLTSEAMEECFPTYRATLAVITLKKGVDMQAFRNRMEQEVQGVSVDQVYMALSTSISSIEDMLRNICRILIIIFLLFGFVIILNVLLMQTTNCQRQYGILKALGFTTGYIIRQNLWEYGILMTISTAIATILHNLFSTALLNMVLQINGARNYTPYTVTLALGGLGMVCVVTILLSLPIKKIAPKNLMEE
ncbi:ABC transporter permease [Anaerosporobacter faecicola]|uniref:ABC transporter permease n=1 Tax=Anaerosporobacter faecicola TaxID=2718714 RepID=UPI00143A696E|nr:ABC transporter permease [Anaerosporobacter faecicola]